MLWQPISRWSGRGFLLVPSHKMKPWHSLAIITSLATIFTVTLTTGRGRNIKALSFHRNEDEVLLPPNSLFAVRSVGRVDRLIFVQLVEVVPVAPSKTIFSGLSYTALVAMPAEEVAHL